MEVAMNLGTPESTIGEPFYTVPQASKILNIPASKIRRAIRLGMLPAYGIVNGRKHVLISDIRRLMAANAR